MQEWHQNALTLMDRLVHRFASKVPPAALVAVSGGLFYRHVEKLDVQAIVQKLSRIPSGLRAALMLCDAGLYQEQAAIQRIVDEITEDVIFLSIPIASGAARTSAHQSYLQAFFEEPFDAPGKPAKSLSEPPRRKKIRAYIANNSGDADPHGHAQALGAMHAIDSGYVHAHSSFIMDTYAGHIPHFHTQGMLGTPREPEYRWHLENYYFRGLSAFAFASMVFGDSQAYDDVNWQMKVFEQVLKVAEDKM